MRFRNTRIGAVIDAPEGFGGKYWEPVGPAPATAQKKTEAPKKAPAKKKAAPKK